MSHEIRTEITIAATPDKVWAALVDFAAYPQWNPFVRSVAGEARQGARLVVAVAPPGGRGMTFRPQVLTAEPGRELRWRGSLPVPGLFDGEHYFRLEPAGAGATRLVHGEQFSGLLVPLMARNLDGGTRNGFALMNEALKARVEAGAHP